MRRSLAVSLSLVLAAGVIPLFPTPARATSVSGEEVVHGGFYSDQGTSTDLNNLAAAAGKRVTFGGTFGSVFENDEATHGWSNTRDRLEHIWQGKATPFLNLEFTKQGLWVTSSAIAAGHWDAKLDSWIDHLESWLDMGGGRSLVLAPIQEMNGDWTSWGCDPGNYRQAYRRIVDRIRARGIGETQVRFAFAPNGWSACHSIPEYYPGDSYVDLIGISAYRWNGSDSVHKVMGQHLDQLAAWYPTKPLVVAQTAARISPKSQWIRDMFAYTASHPHVVATVWFNFFGTDGDWRIWYGHNLDPGWRDGMQRSTTAYEWPLTSWFQPGPLTLGVNPGADLCPDGAECDTVAFQDSGGRFRIWTEATSGETASSFFYGDPGDVPFSGDWNCDGVETLGLYRRSTGYAYLRNSNTQGPGEIKFFFGIPGDMPISGDFDGDGCDTVSIYRPSEGRFYIINELGSDDRGLPAEYSFVFGDVGDKPFVGDFNDDGTDTIGLHRESNGLVYFRNSNTSGFADSHFVYGIPGDRLIAGDWDGDGDDTIGVYRPSNGRFYLRNSNTQGVADSHVYARPQSALVAIAP